MSAAEYRAAIQQIGLSQRRASLFLGVDERTSRRWAKNGPPEAVAKLLRVMVMFDLLPCEVEAIAPSRYMATETTDDAKASF